MHQCNKKSQLFGLEVREVINRLLLHIHPLSVCTCSLCICRPPHTIHMHTHYLQLTSTFCGNKSKDEGIEKQHSTSEAIVPCSALVNELGKGQLGFPLLTKNLYIFTSLISHFCCVSFAHVISISCVVHANIPTLALMSLNCSLECISRRRRQVIILLCETGNRIMNCWGFRH